MHHIRYHQDSGETKVHYSLPVESSLSVELMNLGGQTVRRYEPVTNRPGLHEMDLDLSGLPTGTYLYRIETLGQLFSGKVVKTN